MPLPSTPPPGILAEGDSAGSPSVGGPGQRYALGPETQAPSVATADLAAPPELPSAYGTGKLLLVARDPHWIYAHWDLTDEQLSRYNRQSALGHLALRVFTGGAADRLVLEQEVHPESRTWFLHVPVAGASYAAELGYPTAAGIWTTISRSSATLTPSDALSPDTWARFETVPFVIPPAQAATLVREAAEASASVAEAVLEASAAAGVPLAAPAPAPTPAPEPQPSAPAAPQPAAPEPAFVAQSPVAIAAAPASEAPSFSETTSAAAPTAPAPSGEPPTHPHGTPAPSGSPARTTVSPPSTSAPRWTPAQEQALAELISVDTSRRVWIGSLEITELLRRQLVRGISSAESPAGVDTPPSLPGLPPAGQTGSTLAGPSPTSLFAAPGAEVEKPRGFRFEVNAELILYGATEPDAQVTVAGRPIRLRPDGSFTFRFALPDGRYPLEIIATSADAVEQRSADLLFGRSTEYRGDVGAHPQDPDLRPPTPGHVA